MFPPSVPFSFIKKCGCFGSPSLWTPNIWVFRNVWKYRRPVTLTPIVEPSVCSWAVTTCFYDLGLSRLGFEHKTFRLRGERFYPPRCRRGSLDSELFSKIGQSSIMICKIGNPTIPDKVHVYTFVQFRKGFLTMVLEMLAMLNIIAMIAELHLNTDYTDIDAYLCINIM